MSENFNYLFYYLEKENITIDKSEFLFQIQSHPDYPSLLSISDTLRFFNIENGAIHIAVSEIELLPNRFVTLLKEDDNEPQFCFVERKSNKYYYTIDKKTSEISKTSLESRWNGVVLLAERLEFGEQKMKKNKLTWVLALLCIVLFLLTLFQFETNLGTKLFFLFPTLGFLFSLAALKDLIGTKSELINNFCNITSSTSCTIIVNSDKWKFFKFINFSDLSMVFFMSQFFGLTASILVGNYDAFFSIQEILLFASIPFILLSLYYQKIVEKKWCPICLVIITIIILELVYLILNTNNSLKISFKSFVVFGFVYLGIVLIWTVLKKNLKQQKDLKEFQFESNRFMRNYEIFKNTLVSKNKIELAYSPIILGNKESNTEITIITSPFCGHCKQVHEILDKILSINKENLKVKLLINADIDAIDDEKKTFFRILMSIYLVKGETAFLEALHYWFNNKNLKNWTNIYNLTFENEKIDAIYRLQNLWCITNNTFSTPAIFLNGYKYPRSYKRENLEFFVNEFVEDNL